jgi:hypothetical protein
MLSNFVAGNAVPKVLAAVAAQRAPRLPELSAVPPAHSAPRDMPEHDRVPGRRLTARAAA